MAKCGWRNIDIATLEQEHVDWDKGTITRKRHKTEKKENTPEVQYKLWPETFALLKKHRNTRAGSQLVLVNENGNSLVPSRIDDDAKKGTVLRKSDAIRNDVYRWEKKKGKLGFTLKQIRAAGATLLESNPEYRHLVPLYLGHSTKTVAEQSYAQYPQDLFDEAIDWLRDQFLSA